MYRIPYKHLRSNCRNDRNGHAGQFTRERTNPPLRQRIRQFSAGPLQAIALPDPVDCPPIDDQPPSRVSR